MIRTEVLTLAKKKTVKVASEEAVKEEIAKEVVAETAETLTPETTEGAPAPEVQKKPRSTRKKASPKKETAKPIIKEAEKVAAGFDVQGTAWLYFTAVVPKAIKTITGKVYAWGEENSGRIPVTKNPDGAGKLSELLGWVDKGDLK